MKYTLISVGDLIRKEIQNETEDGQKIKYLFENKCMIDTYMATKLVVKAMIDQKSNAYLIEGFPRTYE